MTVLFFIFVALVVFHFIWEGIVAPSVRLEMRYDLFKLRDDLRRLKIEHSDQIPDEVFTHLQKSINGSIRMLHQANIGNMYQGHKMFGGDKELLAELEKLEKLIKDCPVKEIGQIETKSVGLVAVAFLVNSGGWAILVLPFVLLLLSYSTIRLLIKKLVGLPERDIDNLFPPRHSHA